MSDSSNNNTETRGFFARRSATIGALLGYYASKHFMHIAKDESVLNCSLLLLGGLVLFGFLLDEDNPFPRFLLGAFCMAFSCCAMYGLFN